MNATKFVLGLFLAFFVIYTMATIYWTAQNHDSFRMPKYAGTTRTDCIFDYDFLTIRNDSRFLVFFVCYSVIVRFIGLFVYGIFGTYFTTTIGQYIYFGNMTMILSLYFSGAVCVNDYEMIGHLVLMLIGIVWMGKSIFGKADQGEQQDGDDRGMVIVGGAILPAMDQASGRVRFADEQF